MNTTLNNGEPPYTTGDTRNTVPYGLGFFFVIIFLLITLCYGSYIYKSAIRIQHSRRQPPPPPRTAISTNGGHHSHDDDHIITFSQGLDDEALMKFPTFVYSEAMMASKVDASSETNGSGCSVCLAEYKPGDVLRLLPECGHLFHLSCVDTWLKVNPTCPVCRKSPLPKV